MCLQLFKISWMRERGRLGCKIHILIHFQLQANQFLTTLGYAKILVIANQQHSVVVHQASLALLSKSIDGKRYYNTLLQELIIPLQVIHLASYIFLHSQTFQHLLLISLLHKYEKSGISISAAKLFILCKYTHN